MTIAEDAPLTDESVLDYTQRLRKRVVERLTNDGKIPEDPKDVMTLNTVLDSMDRTALGSIRAKREGEVGDLTKQATALIQEVMGRIGNKDIFAAPVASPRTVPEIPEEMANPATVPGELEVGISNMTSSQFLAEFEAKKAAEGKPVIED